MSVHCEVAGRCGGCPWIGRPYEEQLEAKRAHLRALWREAGLPADVVAAPPIASAGEAGLRDRVDLAWRRVEGMPVFGMWDVENAVLVDVGACPAASAPLRDFLQWLRADPPPIDRASLRLRVDPEGTRGLWVDAANVDVKTLMDEGGWLRRLLAAGVVVEIGQRRKPLYADPEDGRLRLSKDVELRPWFRTWIGARAVPLYGPVGGFSQPSLAANRLLVGRAVALCAETGARRWLELGAGNGNLTLPLAGTGAEVTALELDGAAREGLLRSAAEQGLAVEAVAADVHRAAGLGPLIDAAEAVLADPPRSGLRGFVDALAAREVRPAHLVYVSCHADSLVADAARLAAIGYAPARVEGVDQFPQSPHIEWLVRFALATPAARSDTPGPRSGPQSPVTARGTSVAPCRERTTWRDDMARKTHPEDGVETPPKRISPEIRAAARSRREPPPATEERYWSSIPLGASEDAARFPEEHGDTAD